MNAPFNPGRGFRDPVLGAQAIFRATLKAMSRPGLIVAIPEVGVLGPSALSSDVLAILLALCDQDTPVWLDADLRAGGVDRWLSFHANCPMAATPGEAAFAVLRRSSGNPSLADFALGDARYPDRSTTVLVLADSFSGGPSLTLQGPGIENSLRIAPAGVPDGFVEQAQLNHALYPRGLDFLMISSHAMSGLPRSTIISTEAR